MGKTERAARAAPLALVLLFALIMAMPATRAATTQTIYFRNNAFVGPIPAGFGCSPNLGVSQSPGSGAMEQDSNACWYLGPIAGTFPGGDFAFHTWLRADADQLSPVASMDVVDSVDGSEPTSHTCDPQRTVVAAYAEYVCTVTGTEPYAPPSGSYTIVFTLAGGANFHASVGAASPGQGFSYAVGSFGIPAPPVGGPAPTSNVPTLAQVIAVDALLIAVAVAVVLLLALIVAALRPLLPWLAVVLLFAVVVWLIFSGAA